MVRVSRAGGAALVVTVLLAGAAGAGGYAAAGSHRGAGSTSAPSASPPASASVPPVVRAVGSAPAPVATTAASPTGLSPRSVAAALRAGLRSPALGRVNAAVQDLSTGRMLVDQRAGKPVSPASTAKLLTAAALLTVYRTGTRFTTTVRAGRDGDVILVGGGDPTLSGAAAGRASRYASAARLSDLAAAVRRAGVRPRRIVVDGGLFTGPSVAPSWAAEDVPSSYAAAITALMVDGGRAQPGAVDRSAEPDLAAGRALASELGLPHLSVVRGAAPAHTRVLGAVHSASLSVLIAQMLLSSDDVMADVLGRQVALAEHEPAGFTGAAGAIRTVLRTTYGFDAGPGMLDASGLSARDRTPMAAVLAVLRVAAARPQLRQILADLPVAGWSGTLIRPLSPGWFPGRCRRGASKNRHLDRCVGPRWRRACAVG